MRRSDSIAAVTAELPKEKYIRDIYGKTHLRVKTCPTCRKTKPIAAFYLQSKQFRKAPDQVRDDCKICYDVKVKKQKQERRGVVLSIGADLYSHLDIPYEKPKTFNPQKKKKKPSPGNDLLEWM